MWTGKGGGLGKKGGRILIERRTNFFKAIGLFQIGTDLIILIFHNFSYKYFAISFFFNIPMKSLWQSKSSPLLLNELYKYRNHNFNALFLNFL